MTGDPLIVLVLVILLIAALVLGSLLGSLLSTFWRHNASRSKLRQGGAATDLVGGRLVARPIDDPEPPWLELLFQDTDVDIRSFANDYRENRQRIRRLVGKFIEMYDAAAPYNPPPPMFPPDAITYIRTVTSGEYNPAVYGIKSRIDDLVLRHELASRSLSINDFAAYNVSIESAPGARDGIVYRELIRLDREVTRLVALARPSPALAVLIAQFDVINTELFNNYPIRLSLKISDALSKARGNFVSNLEEAETVIMPITAPHCVVKFTGDYTATDPAAGDSDCRLRQNHLASGPAITYTVVVGRDRRAALEATQRAAARRAAAGRAPPPDERATEYILETNLAPEGVQKLAEDVAVDLRAHVPAATSKPSSSNKIRGTIYRILKPAWILQHMTTYE